MKQDRPLIFLDAGGSAFGAQSEPTCSELDPNMFLRCILEEFKKFLDNRITIENLILKLGDRLYRSGFFIPLCYKLVYPSNEDEILIGSYSTRYKQANELHTKFGIQLRVSFENPDTITVYTSNNGENRKVSRQFAEEFANILNTLFDPNNDGEYLDGINVAEYSVHDDSLESRDLAFGIKDADFPIIGVCFHLEPDGKLCELLSSSEGLDKLIQLFSLFFDSIAGDI